MIGLRDGALVRIRPIRGDDKDRLTAGHARLSAETVRHRFHAAKPRLTRADLRYLTEIDGWDHVALVATPLEDPEAIVAVGRFVRLAEDPETAEFAIVVGDAWQSRGLGRLLAEALVERALQRGVRRFTATTLQENVAVKRLIARIARRLEYADRSGATSTIVAELAA